MITPRRFAGYNPQPERPRIATRPLLIVGFSAVVLVALSGAFLIGLAVVGLVAAAVGSFDLLRRLIWRTAKPSLGALDHQAVG
jgi:hypothetical protein